jgi:hypothetical protein
MVFEPELGQAIFSNTQWQEIEMEPNVERMLLLLGDELKAQGLVVENPCFNVGEQYENTTFAVRSYCWCDGDRHPEGCPANFQWRDFRAAWYKHVSRGNSQNRSSSNSEVLEMLNECVASIHTPDSQTPVVP